MTDPANRWGDDARDRPDAEPPRRDHDTGTPVALVLALLGGLLVALLVAAGALFFFLRADRVRVAAEMEARLAEAEAQRQAAVAARGQDEVVGNPLARDPDWPDVPLPRRGGLAHEPVPQPPATAFPTDVAGDPGRWRVLFRSKNPELWNTNTQAGDDFALPVWSAPPDTRYLRLRRMDTGEAIIIPFERRRIARADPPGRPVRWTGEGREEHGGIQLGIADGPDANPGSGFGHAHGVENGGQRFAWKGQEIKPTAFEVAVTAAELTDAEKKWLRE